MEKGDKQKSIDKYLLLTRVIFVVNALFVGACFLHVDS